MAIYTIVQNKSVPSTKLNISNPLTSQNTHQYFQSGFTLIELMVVIAIISILASFAAPKLTRHITKANLVKIHVLANQSQAVIEEYIMIHARFPNENEFSTWSPNNKNNEEVKSLTIDKHNGLTGTFKITLNTLIGLNSEHYFLFVRDDNAAWHCQSSLQSDFLPKHCTSQAKNDGETP